MVIIIIGPSGCGKDTQARLLVTKLGIPNISTGRLLREEIADKTLVGGIVEAYVTRGIWVPDDIMYKLLLERLMHPDTKKGFILNGYPRTEAQIDQLDRIVEKRLESIDKVIHFDLPEEEIIKRLKSQRKDGEVRPDRTDEAIQTRIESYQKTIQPILEEYKRRGVLLNVDATPGIEEIHEGICEELGLEK